MTAEMNTNVKDNYAQTRLAQAKTKEERIQAYADIRKHFGQVRGLFRIIHAKDYGEIQTSRGVAHKFAYLCTPAGKKNNDEGLDNDQFVWMNELIAPKGGSVQIIKERQELVQQFADGKIRSSRVNIVYKVNKRGNAIYRDVHDVRDRNKKPAANA